MIGKQYPDRKETKYQLRGTEIYVDSNSWKCDKSPTGAHLWIEDMSTASKTCEHCDKNVKVASLADIYKANSHGFRPFGQYAKRVKGYSTLSRSKS